MLLLLYLGSALLAGTRLLRMYGPPRDCKGKVWTRRQVCANVFVNKGEGSVKGRDLLTVAMSNARDQGV